MNEIPPWMAVSGVAAASLIPLWTLVGAILSRKAIPKHEEIVKMPVPKKSNTVAPKWKPADVYRHQEDAWMGTRERKLSAVEDPPANMIKPRSKWKCSDVYREGPVKEGWFSGVESVEKGTQLPRVSHD
jgi:hypothetical protein